MADQTAYNRARPTQIMPAQSLVMTWHYTVPPAISLDDLLKPDFWSHVAVRLRPHNRVIADAEDGSWTATLFVRSVNRLSATMAVQSFMEFGEKSALSDSVATFADFDIGWGGPAHKHRVVRKSDGAIMTKGHDTSEDAGMWLKNHIAVLDRSAA